MHKTESEGSKSRKYTVRHNEEHSAAGAKRKVAEEGDQEKAAASICETARDIESVGMVGAGEVNNSYISRTAI